MDKITTKQELQQKLKEAGVDYNAISEYCRANYYPNKPKLYINVFDQTEEESIKLILFNPYHIKYVRKQTVLMCYYAFVKKNYSIIYFNEEMLPYFEDYFYNCLEKDRSIFKQMNYQTENICIAAINKSADNIKYVKNKTEKILLALDKKLKQQKKPHKSRYTEDIYKDFRKYMKEKYADLYIKDDNIIYKLNNMPDDMLIYLIRKNPSFIKHVENQTKKLVDLAFTSDYKVYKYIKDITYDMIKTVRMVDNRIHIVTASEIDKLKNIMGSNNILPDLTKIPYITISIKKYLLNCLDLAENIDDLSYNDCAKLIDYDPKTFLLITWGSNDLYLYLINNCKNKSHVSYVLNHYVKNPSEIVLTEAREKGIYNDLNKISFNKLNLKDQLNYLTQNGTFIEFLDNPTQEIAEIAFKTYLKAIKYIKNPTEEMCLIALKRDPKSIQYIKSPTKEMCLIALKRNPKCIKYIKNPTEEMYLIAVQYDYSYTKFIKNPTEEMYLKFVRYCDPSLIYIENPTEEMCLLSLKRNSSSIKYIKNPTEEMCLISLKSDPKNIKYITNPTEEMCLIAVLYNASYIKLIKNPTEETCLAIIKNKGSNIQYIENPTEEMCLIAIRENKTSINYINNTTEKMYALVEEIRLSEEKAIESYIKNSENITEEQIIEKINNNPEEIHLVKNITPSIKLAFVKKLTTYKIGYFDENYIQNQFVRFNIEDFLFKEKYVDKETIIKLFINNPFLIKCLNAKPSYVCEQIFDIYPQAFKYIDNPTDEMIIKLLQIHHNYILYVKNPTYEMLDLAVDNMWVYKILDNVPVEILYKVIYNELKSDIANIEKFDFTLFDYLY